MRLEKVTQKVIYNLELDGEELRDLIFTVQTLRNIQRERGCVPSLTNDQVHLLDTLQAPPSVRT